MVACPEQPESSPFGLLIPDAEPAFLDTAYLRRFGFIASATSAENPDGLPIGFARTEFQNLPGVSASSTALGLTCAACHTRRFTYGDTEYLVEGGPSTVDLDGFSSALGAALGQTLLSATLRTPNRRFKRFAHRVLGCCDEGHWQRGKARNRSLAEQSRQEFTPVAWQWFVCKPREGAMLGFRSIRSLQKFASAHSSVHNHFNLERHLYSRANFKHHRATALAEMSSTLYVIRGSVAAVLTETGSHPSDSAK
ncbi:MAG: hypothetical protein ACI8R4_001210 [Paracoccaceae bacterium]|jgi:hypothetical protein